MGRGSGRTRGVSELSTRLEYAPSAALECFALLGLRMEPLINPDPAEGFRDPPVTSAVTRAPSEDRSHVRDALIETRPRPREDEA